MSQRRIARILMSAAATVALGAVPALAQNYPERTIELVVPSTPGASADILGRALADEMSKHLGQPVIVVNKPSGIVGTGFVSRAKPDGYTLLHAAAVSVTVAPLTDSKIGYTHKSFDPICHTFKNDQVIVARNNTYKTVKDILEATKKKEGGLSVGIPGIATIPHLAVVELGQLTKTEFNGVPFRGPAESIQMMIGGHVDFTVAPLTAAAKSGLEMPGLFADKRNPAMPDVPTVAEQGYDVSPLSFGLMAAPAGLPADIKKKLDEACRIAANSEQYKKLARNRMQPTDYYGDSAAAAKLVELDVAQKRRLLTSLGMVK